MTDKTRRPTNQLPLIMLLLVALVGGAWWMQFELQSIRAEVKALSLRVGQSPARSASPHPAESLQKEITPLRAQIEQTASQSSEMARRLDSLESAYKAINTAHENVNKIVDGYQKSREIMDKVETLSAQVESPIAETPQKPIQQTVQKVVVEPLPPPRRSALVIVTSVSVKSTKANGKEWDDGAGDPDLTVEITNNGNSVKTSKVSDSLFASFEERLLRVSVGDTIRVKVIDEDAFLDDTVAVYSKEITDSTLDAGTADWAFGQVESLQLKFEP